MGRRDVKLMILGAAPAVALVVLMAVLLLMGNPFAAAVKVLALAGILAATIFPALANFLGVRGTR